MCSRASLNQNFGRQLINSSRGLTRASVKAGLTRTPVTSANCFSCSGPGLGAPGCSLFNPPAEAGFPGSVVFSMGGTTLVDPATCAGAMAGDDTLGSLKNVAGSVNCANDGDVLMFKAGTGTSPGQWVAVSLREALARACLREPDTLGAVDCATSQSRFPNRNNACAGVTTQVEDEEVQVTRGATVMSSRDLVMETPLSQTFGSGGDGDLKLEGDSELTTDMYFQNLNLNGFTLFSNGYRLFVNGTLSAGTEQPGSIACNGQDGSINSAGQGGLSASLGGGGNGNASAPDYSISGSAGSDGQGQLGPAASLVSEVEGGLGLLSELDTAIRMRALDGRRLTGGAGGVGPHAGGGGGIVFVAARKNNGAGTLQARGGAASLADSGAGGGGAVVYIHSGASAWKFDVRGGDAVAQSGKAFDVRI